MPSQEDQENKPSTIPEFLFDVQQNMEPLHKAERANAGGRKSFTYATLEALMDALHKFLQKHRVVIKQRLTPPDEHQVAGQVTIRTTLQQIDTAEVDEMDISMPVDRDDAHAVGSAMSYARRYAIYVMLNIITSDDEGVAAVKSKSRKKGDDPAPKQKTKKREPLSDRIGKAIQNLGRAGVEESALVTFLGKPATEWTHLDVDKLGHNRAEIIREEGRSAQPA